MLRRAMLRRAMLRRAMLRRAVLVILPALAFGSLIAIQVRYFDRGFVPGDAFVYLSAGERLNAGHHLYSLMPGDRNVDLHPPFWTVPFVSPPPMAVLWRPLAALPFELGVYVWWAAQVTALLASVLMLMRRKPILTSFAVMALAFPMVYEIGVGNVNSFLLLGMIAMWRLSRDERDRSVGALAAVMTAVKVTPMMLGWWILVRRRWEGVVAYVLAGLAVFGVSLLGAGLASHLQYLSIAAGNGVAPSPLSLGGMASYIGAPAALADELPRLALILGLVAVWALRRRADLAFIAAVVTMIAASPAVSINWYILLLATLAPVAWPLRERQPAPAAGAVSDRLEVAALANTQPSSSA